MRSEPKVTGARTKKISQSSTKATVMPICEAQRRAKVPTELRFGDVAGGRGLRAAHAIASGDELGGRDVRGRSDWKLPVEAISRMMSMSSLRL